MVDHSTSFGWNAIGVLVSGLAGIVGVLKYRQWAFIHNARDVTGEDLANGASGVFVLSGNIIPQDSRPVWIIQALVLREDYPSVVVSESKFMTTNQIGKPYLIHREATAVNVMQSPFLLEDRTGCLLIQPDRGMEVFGIQAFIRTGRADLPLWDIIKVIVSVTTFWLGGPSVVSGSIVHEDILPANTSLDVVIEATSFPEGTFIKPKILGVSRVHIEQFYKASAVRWLALSASIGAAALLFKLRSIYRKWLAKKEAEEYAEWRKNVPSELICILCHDHPRDLALYPCHHVCVCRDCGAPLENCPVCRRPIEKAVPVRFHPGVAAGEAFQS